jgi:hypothetical protein
METWAELTEPNPTGYVGTSDGDTNSGTKFQNMSGMGGALSNGGDTRHFVPLQFWFCRNPGLALPLIALQYHEVKVILQHTIGDGYGNSATTNNLYCDYIYLDTDERRRFAQVSHEYLINQVQYNGKSVLAATENTANVDLRFNHPCKEVVWVVQDTSLESCGSTNTGNHSPWKYRYNGTATDVVDNVSKAVIQLNGHDRFREREGTYFRTVQPYQHHTGLFDNGQSSDGATNDNKGMFYTYSFALKPEEHQPSGTCNFSRIDNAVLTMTLADEASKPRSIKVYATNYNVLRIMSGMGGLAYSN